MKPAQSSATMEALILRGAGDLRHETVPRPVPEAGQALVRVAAAGVTATDLAHVFARDVAPYPRIPGHQLTGEVVALGEDGPLREGQRVTASPLIPCGRCRYCQVGAYGQCEGYAYLGLDGDGAWAEYVCLPQANLVPLPDGLSPMAAALTELVAAALHALRLAEVEPGERVAILGCGPLALIAAQWARIMGTQQVLLTSTSSRRLGLAGEMWLGETCDAREVDPVAWCWDLTQGHGVDVVLETTGESTMLGKALRMARPRGRVIVATVPQTDLRIERDTLSRMVRKEIKALGSWGATQAPLPVDEWRLSLESMAGRRIDVRPLTGQQITFAQASDLLRQMWEGELDCVGTLLRPASTTLP